MGKQKTIASARVRCNGQIHEILLTDRLKIGLKNHPKKQRQAEKVASAITQKQAPKCLLLLDKLKVQYIRKPALYERVKNLPKPIKSMLLQLRPDTYKYRGSVLNSNRFFKDGKPPLLFIEPSWYHSRTTRLLDRQAKRKQLQIGYLSAVLPSRLRIEAAYILLRYRILECPEIRKITYWTSARVSKIDNEHLLLVTTAGPTRIFNYYICEKNKAPEPIDDTQGKRLDNPMNSRYVIAPS